MPWFWSSSGIAVVIGSIGSRDFELLETWLWAIFRACIVPWALLLLPVGYVELKENLSEHPTFRRWFRHGKGGSARWAGPRTFENHEHNCFRTTPDKINGHYAPALYLGRTLFEDTFLSKDIWIKDDAHMLTIGCTGSGKSTTVVWPNLALYEGRAFVLDPKGEHARKTFWRRNERMAHRAFQDKDIKTRFHLPFTCHLLDPFGEVKELPSKRFNPIAEIDINSDRVRGALSGISDACVLPEDPKNKHFEEMASLLLEGVIAHVLSQHPKEHHTLPFVCDLMIGMDPAIGAADPERFNELLIEMRLNNVAGGIAQLAAARLDEMGPNERGSVLSTLTRSVKWITDPAMRVHLSGSDFSAKEWASPYVSLHMGTIYLVLPFNFMREQSRWMRTITNVFLWHIQSAPKAGNFGTKLPQIPILFILDEFPMLGRIKKIEEGVVTLRSAGVKLWPLVQNIGQLKSTFGDEMDNFISSSTVQLFGVNDMNTAQWASDIIGKNAYKRHEKTGTFSRRVVQDDPRELATPAEIMEELGKSSPMQYVRPMTGHPMRLSRLAYKELEIEGHRFKGLPLEGHFEE
jgi:type IV secretion system protein VirD4